MPDKTSNTENNDNTDYLKLARELAETKRQMAKLHYVRGIPEPDHGEVFVLGYLANIGKPVCPKDIGDAMKISSARIAKLLNQLEHKSFIKRRVDPLNRRQTLIHLLPAGSEQHQKDTDNFNKDAIKFLKALGAEDAADYIRLQKRILEIYTDL